MSMRLGKTVGRRARVSLGAGVAMALLVSACTAGGPVVQRPPQSGAIETIEPSVNGRASVGLVLGAGGSRGFAHLGVIKVLEEAGLRPDIGLYLCQWARALGARVLGTVSGEDKARLARDNGCELPIISRDYRFARAVQDATSGRGVDVIYDGLGRAAADENLQALALCGHWVSYGQATGPLAPISAEALSARSVTLSRPVIFHYTAERAALNEIAQQTFAALRGGVLRVERRHRYPLASAAEAHRDLEGRRTSGPLVLLP